MLLGASVNNFDHENFLYLNINGEKVLAHNMIRQRTIIKEFPFDMNFGTIVSFSYALFM